MWYSYSHDRTLRNSKSIVGVKYNLCDHITDYVIDTLPSDVRKDLNKSYPCVVVKYRHHNRISTSVMRVCNSFNHFFTTNKLNHFRRCDICLDKATHF